MRSFRHDSIPTAINAFRQQSSSHNIQFDNTEDQTLFTDSYLSQYDAIIFLSNTGQGLCLCPTLAVSTAMLVISVLDDPGIVAFQNWVNQGGNFIGVHAASDSLRNNSFFEQELGNYVVEAAMSC
jgi:Trehalose utilisation